jgi:hypothetical protein
MTIPAIVFGGVGEAKHQCRPATEEESQRGETELPITVPGFFKYGWQRFCEVLVEYLLQEANKSTGGVTNAMSRVE